MTSSPLRFDNQTLYYRFRAIRGGHLDRGTEVAALGRVTSFGSAFARRLTPRSSRFSGPTTSTRRSAEMWSGWLYLPAPSASRPLGVGSQ